MQQTLQSKFLLTSSRLSFPLPRNILHYESLLMTSSFALLSSYARHLSLSLSFSLFNALC
jgi:hypothetical protein